MRASTKAYTTGPILCAVAAHLALLFLPEQQSERAQTQKNAQTHEPPYLQAEYEGRLRMLRHLSSRSEAPTFGLGFAEVRCVGEKRGGSMGVSRQPGANSLIQNMTDRVQD